MILLQYAAEAHAALFQLIDVRDIRALKHVCAHMRGTICHTFDLRAHACYEELERRRPAARRERGKQGRGSRSGVQRKRGWGSRGGKLLAHPREDFHKLLRTAKAYTRSACTHTGTHACAERCPTNDRDVQQFVLNTGT